MEDFEKLDVSEISDEVLQPLRTLGENLRASAIPLNLQIMIEIRLSQINGCANCVDVHWKDARALGETEQRLYGLSVWWESPYYSEKERAAFLWAEAVNEGEVSDEIYAEVAKFYSAGDMVQLAMVVNYIASWNRLNIAFPKKIIGDYSSELTAE